jgi:phosphopantothenoylcysteine synthetase/decarboxylase
LVLQRSQITDHHNELIRKSRSVMSPLTLELERTPDILSQVAAARKEGTLVVGFAAESENLLQNAQLKLLTKNLDAIVCKRHHPKRRWI